MSDEPNSSAPDAPGSARFRQLIALCDAVHVVGPCSKVLLSRGSEVRPGNEIYVGTEKEKIPVSRVREPIATRNPTQIVPESQNLALPPSNDEKKSRSHTQVASNLLNWFRKAVTS